ncbi:MULTISPECIES: hypothetical protein [Methylobacterium]|uniref:hypothetical protein n=1 Tax=Methylobacterium TaxID=407 RepID=UPI0012E7ED6B|nr:MULTISPECIES: hypothetical protein [Methylobacterium]MCI9879639.1 hypothetical protein [Methylobacterium goesingense]
MSAVRNLEASEQWITPPEPALDRYRLHACGRAANDNPGSFFKALRILPISACLALSCALTLVVALVR